MWPDRRIIDLFGIEHPILLAPMAGPSTAELGIAVSEAGGLGSLPCAMLTPDQVAASFHTIRQRTVRPINLNFFCHRSPIQDLSRDARWRERLATYYAELGIDSSAAAIIPSRKPFDEAMCDAVVALRPEAVRILDEAIRGIEGKLHASGW